MPKAKKQTKPTQNQIRRNEFKANKRRKKELQLEAMRKIVTELPKSNCKVSWPTPFTLHVRFFACNQVWNWYPNTGTFWNIQTGHVPGDYFTTKDVLAKLLELIRQAKREREQGGNGPSITQV